MKRIETISELKRAWAMVTGRLMEDLNAAGRLAIDPVGTFRELGYVVDDEIRGALLAATRG